MNEKVIKLADAEEVCDFVRAAGRCDFDIDITDQSAVIDAKSIMGIFGLELSKPLRLEIEDWKEEYAAVIERYLRQ